MRAAVLQRLNIEREGLDREEAQASARCEELRSRLNQTQADLTRERELLSDTDGVLARLDAARAECIVSLLDDENAAFCQVIICIYMIINN